ncbi:MAG TPA: DUF167 domain-containing protein [Candidatus Paceibacterota bacterium]|nr:DUF167 domain-containing protein [Candidatus Paceibacterota bacterium]
MKRVTVRVHPGARHASVERTSPDEFAIAVREPAERGRATDAARRALAEHLGIAPSRLSLIMGHASRVKVFLVR